MQLIHELTLIQKVGAFIGIPMILLLLLVAARRRRAAAAGGDPATVAQPEGRRRRAKAEPSIPRRKRRKLAAEAAQAMGTPETAPQPIPVLATATVEPVAAVAEAVPAPAAVAPAVHSPPPVPVAPAPAEDPYVRDTKFAEGQVAAFEPEAQPEVVVAAPGWPTPGELASSFDPDAFDPLPAATEVKYDIEDEPVMDDVDDEPVMDDAEPEQPTGVIEMPASREDGPDEPEMAQWDGEFDPATGWGDDGGPVPVAVAAEAEAEAEDWYDSERTSPRSASSIDEPNPVDLEQFWGDAESEGPWADSPEVEVITDMSTSDGIDETVPAWVEDDQTAPWEAERPNGLSVPFPAPGSLPAHDAASGGWTTAGPAQGSPVILDLAGLAASGHSLELVIESSGDGKGLRLRFGSPNGAPAPVAEPDATEFAPPVLQAEIEELVETPEIAYEIELPVVDESDAEPPADEHPMAVGFDVPFLTGGNPEPDTAHVAMTDPDLAVEAPAVAAPVEVTHLPIVEDEPAFDASPETVEVVEIAPAPPVAPELDPSDDPVQILADIRARLAALDGRR